MRVFKRFTLVCKRIFPSFFSNPLIFLPHPLFLVVLDRMKLTFFDIT